nr:AAA family ATPase [Nocardioides soli]
MPTLLTLDNVLARPRIAPKFLIDGVWPYDGTTLHVAQRKTGKTALTLNLTRSLVDGEPFLGVFDCAGGERVALVNLEDPENALADLLECQGIADLGAVLPVSLNGNARAFDVMTDQGRARWAAALADNGITVLIVDPLKPLVDAFGLDEWRQTGELFNAIKACAHEAGIRHVHVSHHAGHGLEGGRVRARGDSSLEGTADALWFSAMDDPTDARSARQFSALGRGVSIDKGALLLDAATGRQTYTTKAAGLVIVKRHAVVDYLTDNGTTSRQDLIANVTGLDKNNARSVLAALVASGEVVETRDPGRSHAKRYALPKTPDEMFPEESSIQ